MMVKLDITKAFDKLSWKYMRGIMGAFGFGREWIEWIKNMVTNTFYFIMLNGSPT